MDQLLMEKCEANFRDDYRPERAPEYDVQERLEAIDELLASFKGLQEKVDSYKRGNSEEQRYYRECGRMREMINLYVRVLQQDHDDLWDDYCEMEDKGA